MNTEVALSDPLNTTTVDQESPGLRGSRLTAEPFVEVLQHAHLPQWGLVSPPEALADGRTLHFGRATSLVAPWAPDEPRPVGDPCLSRELFEIAFVGREFLVKVCSDRRGISFRDPLGRVLPRDRGAHTRLAPGTRIVVEDRLVLSLEYRVSPVHWHAWYREKFPLEAEEDTHPERPLGLIGETEAAWRLRRMILALPVGPQDVFLEGETGSGKELVAAAVHRRMRGRKAPFVTVNCASIPATLFESELFGHVGGAFSGASREGRSGAFREADRGTLFLDEIAELPLDVQAKLNRAIENRVVVPVGARHTEPMRVDVLMIYATWQALGDLVAAARFRADLMNRCQRLHISVPSLAERRNDVPRLMRHMLEHMRERAQTEVDAGTLTLSSRRLDDLFVDPGHRRPLIDQRVVLAFAERAWPEGNIRSLNNRVLRSAFAYLAEGVFDGAETDAPLEVETVPGPGPEAMPVPPARPVTARRSPESITALEWQDAYRTLGSVRRVAAHFGCSLGTADKYLRLAGAEMSRPNLAGRPRSEDSP
jgi:hypothetical protein